MSVDHVREDEAALVERARAGDGTAFEALFRRHYADAVAAARAVGLAGHQAEEAAQDGFVKAWRALDRFRGGAPFRPWLRTIVLNEARSQQRAQRRRRALDARLGNEAATRPGQRGPEEALLSREASDDLDGAVAGLSEIDRQVVRLRYSLGLSEAETARRIGRPPGTVKSRLSRALGRLREHLAVALIALLLALAGAALAVPSVRAELGRLLGITGAERLFSVERLPRHLSGRPVDWGPRLGAAEARALVPFAFPTPAWRGLEPEVRARTDLAAGAVTLDYGDVQVTVMDAAGAPVLAKLVPRGHPPRRVEVAGGSGLWMSGVPRALAFLDRSGRFRPGPLTRVDRSVLAWDGPGRRPLSFRLETVLPLRAVLPLAGRIAAGSRSR